MQNLILGIAGWAGAGKDTFADLLVERHSFTKMAFADPLREIAAAINPIVAVEQTLEIITDDECRDEALAGFDFIRYNDAIERHGYNKAKFMFNGEIRGLLQRIGTEAGRKIISDTLWVDMAMKRAAEHKRVVIADMRFQNEANAVTKAGGTTIRILRPGVGPANAHISEHDLDEWVFDYIVSNDSSIDSLGLSVEAIFEELV